MNGPFLAMIIPVGGGAPPRPDQGLPQPPLGIWGPTDPRPGWGLPQPPLGTWGGVGQPYPDQGLPGAPPNKPPGFWGGVAPPHPDQGLPGIPPGIWGGKPPYVDIGGPGPQPTPTPPIWLPPGSLPGVELPIYIPPIVNIPGFPTHPIQLPPPGSNDKPQVLENWDVKTAWSPSSGWVVAIVPSEEHPGVPTPS
jgi:hypothetical protein